MSNVTFPALLVLFTLCKPTSTCLLPSGDVLLALLEPRSLALFVPHALNVSSTALPPCGSAFKLSSTAPPPSCDAGSTALPPCGQAFPMANVASPALLVLFTLCNAGSMTLHECG